ncbi:MAG: hypothetical protein PQJ50_16100 [Spirochaetales bacterium]|nr:hypothetical protein [Spirochaetales bacterium]
MINKTDVGLGLDLGDERVKDRFTRYINLKLTSMGQPIFNKVDHQDIDIAQDLIARFRERNRLFSKVFCPVDQRIQSFLNKYLEDLNLEKTPRLPYNTFILDKYGLARTLSIAPDKDEFVTDIVSSHRIKQGILNNPKNDRRTTKGSFHVAEGGLDIPFDKKAVPKITFARLLEKAFDPPKDLMELPFTSSQQEKARTFVSLLLKPTVCPEVPGVIEEKVMEVRFFAPGNLVSNLDFVESIFGNAGDPNLSVNDSALDPEHWSGHTGCVILAPHILGMNKKELGLPYYDDATERQKKDGMCWKEEDEKYNNGTPFKLTCRTEEGIIVTLIADNYFGYSKKEVKTQISYATNLMGLAEEEHAGGALAFPQYNQGSYFIADSNLHSKGHNFKDVLKLMGDQVTLRPEGYAVDNNFPSIIYLPESMTMEVEDQYVKWIDEKGNPQKLRILPENTYIHPTGYKLHIEQHPQTPSWRLVGTVAEGTLCHKPCTVSGGGKSEISKSLWDAIIFGPVYINDFEKDMEEVESIINKYYGDRFLVPRTDHVSRPILSDQRSLGSVIKLLTPTDENTEEFNNWLESIPNNIKALVYYVKRFYNPDWGDNWKDQFSVDIVNGEPGKQIKFQKRSLSAQYLRVGSRQDGSGWVFKLRNDFMPAEKVQWEDDISASIVVPADQIKNLNPQYKNGSVKFTKNVESRFFQRPDDAIKRGYDKQAEMDMASKNNFFCNFEPLTSQDAKDIYEHTVSFCEYTDPMREMIEGIFEEEKEQFFCASDRPRIVNGAITKNPRYLQTRPDLEDPKKLYLAELGARLYRKIPVGQPVPLPVNSVLPGRRNNPVDHEAGIRPLAVYGPVHYQELPELFMDFTCSLTGKSPSTPGAGTEGALTKGPFNALVATTDLNSALLSFILTGYNAFSSAAGYIGHKFKVDHDVSLFIPELWSRLSEEERDPKKMIAEGLLEKVEDFDHNGKKILGSRLGYRITRKFTNHYLGRMFDNPEIIFRTEMLQPERQNLDDYVDGINNICETHEKVAREYVKDGSVNKAIPPLKALLYIMAEGSFEGKTIEDPEIRQLFDRDTVIKSDWYNERLDSQQKTMVALYEKHLASLERFVAAPRVEDDPMKDEIKERLEYTRERLAYFKTAAYRKSLVGTIGVDPKF